MARNSVFAAMSCAYKMYTHGNTECTHYVCRGEVGDRDKCNEIGHTHAFLKASRKGGTWKRKGADVFMIMVCMND